MRRAFLLATFSCVLAAAFFSLTRARDARAQVAKAPPAWEYRVLMLTDIVTMQQAIHEPARTGPAIEAKFNELGRDGWDLCENFNGMVVFKRPKP